MAYFGAVAVVLAIAVLIWSVVGLRPDPLERQVRTTLDLDPATARARKAVVAPAIGVPPSAPVIDRVAGAAERVLPSGTSSKLDRQRQLAGMATTWSIHKLLALKLVTLILGIGWGVLLIASNPTGGMILLGGVSAFIGFYGVDAWLSHRAGARQALIGRELADTIDQITICVEAGLGFDAAVARSARTGTGPLAEEFRRVLQDLQVGVPRGQALEQLLERTDVPDLRHFVVALRQAERYGVPIANILRVQATELREKRKAHAEEEAQKLPVKLLFPLILCVLPVLFIILVGPAVIRIAESGLGG